MKAVYILDIKVMYIIFADFCAIPSGKLHQPEHQTFLYRVYVLSLTSTLQLSCAVMANAAYLSHKAAVIW
jgi:hypothetical protein